jgi:hypothetical protein
VGDGAPDVRNPQALGVYLRVALADLDSEEPFEAEFKLVNTGRAPIQVPVSPHLSDLQPSNESLAFNYLSLALVVSVEGARSTSAPPVGFVQLYGTLEDASTVISLMPGEWIRVRANVKLTMSLSEPVSVRMRGTFWLRKNTFRPHPGGFFTETTNLYPNVTVAPPVEVRLVPPRRAKP